MSYRDNVSWPREAAPALALTLGAVVEAVAVYGPDGARLALAILTALPLLWRGSHPRLVWLVVTSAFVVQLPWASARLFEGTFVGYLCLVVAAYALGRFAAQGSARPLGVVGTVACGLVVGVSDRSLSSGLLAVGILGSFALTGEAIALRARARSLLAARASEIADSMAAVAEARALEARALAATSIQGLLHGRVLAMTDAARRARRLIPTDPTRATGVVAQIEEEGRRALADMRRTLSDMRATETTASHPTSPPDVVPARDSLEPWLTLAVLGLAMTEAFFLGRHAGVAAPTACALAGAMALPLLARRSRPIESAVLGWAGACLFSLVVGVSTVMVVVGMLLAAAAGQARSRSRRWVPLGVGIAGVVGVNAVGGPSGQDDHVFPVLLLTMAWVGGAAARTQQALVAEVAAQADELHRTRELRASAAAVEERLRLARELHDVVAHHLVVMVVQAGAARRTTDRGRSGAVESLGAIERTGDETLAELDALMALVTPSGAGSGPAHGMGDLAQLVDRVRAGGLAVDVIVEGAPRSLPGGLDVVAHRIVQESLTNVIRHAEATRVEVRVAYHPDRLTLEIADDGHGLRPDAPAGLGVTGMRERVRLHGGTFALDGCSGRGVQVRATLPLDDSAARTPA